MSFEIVLLVVVTLAVYFGTLDHAFHFDDKQDVWNNSSIQVSSLSTALRFSEHHNADLAMQANVSNIRMSLEKAKQMLKAKQEREVLMKNNSGS